MKDEPVGFAQFVSLVLESLNAAGVEYLVGGAVASWAWGEPRSTMDLDLVVEIPFQSIDRLSEELKKRDMLVPADIMLETLLEDRADIPINAIHMSSGFKADLYPIRERDELRRSAFERRILVDFGPGLGKVFVHSPEDLIIYKVMYFSLSQQTKHVRDIAAIYHTLKNQLDFEYINRWMGKKGLKTIWDELLATIRSET